MPGPATRLIRGRSVGLLGEPARGDRLLAREEIDRVLPVGVEVAEAVLPAGEREERDRRRDADVDSDHAGLHVDPVAARGRSGLGEDRGAVAVAAAVDERDRVVERADLDDRAPGRRSPRAARPCRARRARRSSGATERSRRARGRVRRRRAARPRRPPRRSRRVSAPRPPARSAGPTSTPCSAPSQKAQRLPCAATSSGRSSPPRRRRPRRPRQASHAALAGRANALAMMFSAVLPITASGITTMWFFGIPPRGARACRCTAACRRLGLDLPGRRARRRRCRARTLIGLTTSRPPCTRLTTPAGSSSRSSRNEEDRLRHRRPRAWMRTRSRR